MMLGAFVMIRRAGVAAASAGSVLLGLALVWRFVTRDGLQRATTGELLALLGLLVLPAAAVGAVMIAKRASADEPAPADPEAARTAGMQTTIAATPPARAVAP